MEIRKGSEEGGQTLKSIIASPVSFPSVRIKELLSGRTVDMFIL